MAGRSAARSPVWDAAVAAEQSCGLGEGPWWDERRGRLLWVDVDAAALHAHAPATGETTTGVLAQSATFVVGRRGGGFLVGTAAGLLALDDDLRPRDLLAVPPDLGDGRLRTNDGACDPAGRVLVGTVDPRGERTGTLWSCAPGGAFAALAEGVRMSNGLAFSPDGAWLYYVDTPAQRVDRLRYDVETGRASDRRPFCEVPADVGLPDGLAVDATGCVWVAIWGAGAVWRLTPEGAHAGTLRVAAARSSSCAFGGPRRDRLYVTSARASDAADPADRDGAAGALFVADVAVAGAPVWSAAL